MIRNWKADIVCLQETKLELITRGVICSLWGGQHVDWVYLGSAGGFGGVSVMWDRRAIDKVEEAVACFSVSCKFKNVIDHFEWAFTRVYGLNSDRDRRLLWELLSGLRRWNVPWCVRGDFNVVWFPSEHSGSVYFTMAMHQFFDFITEQVLFDLPLDGGNLLGLILERLFQGLGWTYFFCLQIGMISFYLSMADV